ncbi:flagellar hook-basal body protein [candidate division KSB1 bacterium]
MIRIGVSGMTAYNVGVAVTANNIANSNTTAYKKGRVRFSEATLRSSKILKRNISGAVYSPSASSGGGVAANRVSRNNIQGMISLSQNPTDMAISGEGFFQVILPDGRLAYTRNGAFQKSSDGILVTAEGYELQPQIKIPPNAENIIVEGDGEVKAKIGAENITIGRIQTAQFQNPDGLKSAGAGLLTETASSGQAIIGTPGSGGFGGIIQEGLEGSNVNMAEEQVNLIINQRAFKANAKSVKTADAMLKYTINIKK